LIALVTLPLCFALLQICEYLFIHRADCRKRVQVGWLVGAAVDDDLAIVGIGRADTKAARRAIDFIYRTAALA
jgi:hypothetical protein